MDIPKKYLHDKFVLVIISANAFFTVLIILTVLLRLSGNTAGRFIVQYRENLGLNPFLPGNVLSIISFVIFAVLILVINTTISSRVYEQKRELSLVVLVLTLLLLILALIVSNALLVVQ